MMCNRHYYRCVDCLTIAAADGPELHKATCGNCNGRIEHMGRVYGDRLVKTGLGCPCDGRCTSARGPHCDCHCGGVNHGSNMLVPIVRDCGPVPVLKIAASRVAAAIASEWHEALAATLEYIGDVQRRHASGERIDYEAFQQWQRVDEACRAARKSRSHRHRMKLIRDALPTYRAATAPALQAVLF